MYDGEYINIAVKTMSFPGNFFLLEMHKTMQSFQYPFSGKNCNSSWKEDTSCARVGLFQSQNFQVGILLHIPL